MRQWVIERRGSPTGVWRLMYRDDDEAVMRSRWDYTSERLAPGQSLRLIDPLRKIVLEKTVDTPKQS